MRVPAKSATCSLGFPDNCGHEAIDDVIVCSSVQSRSRYPAMRSLSLLIEGSGFDLVVRYQSTAGC